MCDFEENFFLENKKEIEELEELAKTFDSKFINIAGELDKFCRKNSIDLFDRLNLNISCCYNAIADLTVFMENVCSYNYKFDYYSKEFRKLRLKVFLKQGEICAKCGATPNSNTSLTIDHIMPVSKYPKYAMREENLQVLCWECNQAKSNKHSTDYRKQLDT